MSDDTNKLTEQDAAESFVSRQIVQEIMDYGVTQFQIGKIIFQIFMNLIN